MSTPIDQSIALVQKRIEAACGRSGRDPKEVRLVAVTKGVPPEKIREAVQAGLLIFGENRIQEALLKIAALSSFTQRAEASVGRGKAPSGFASGGGMVAPPIINPTWHFVGHLQRNKAKQAVGTFAFIHSMDSLELARELDRHAASKRIIQTVLIQVNVARESGKHGVAPEGLEALVGEVASLPHLVLEGLMVIPPLAADPEGSRPHFRWLAQRAEELRRGGLPLQELSMGMSNDFEVAIEEGATLIRVGTAIFGRSD